MRKIETSDLLRAFDLFDTPGRTLALAIQEALVLVDDERKIVGMNPQAQELFGLGRGDGVVGSPLSSLISVRHDTYSAHAAQLFERFVLAGEFEPRLSQRQPICGVRADGRKFAAEVSLSCVDFPVPGGTRQYYMALVRDLGSEEDPRKQAAVLQQQVHSMLDSTPVPMWIVENERIVYANRLAVEILGFDEMSQVVGKLVDDCVRVGSVARSNPYSATSRHDSTLLHGDIVRPDGSCHEVVIGSGVLPEHGNAFIQLILIDIGAQQAARAEASRSQDELRKISANVVDAREEERRHIARELHDELGQRLTSLKMELASLRATAVDDDADERFAEMLEMIDETVTAVRSIASDLSPLMLDDLGLNSAIEWLARDVARRMDMEVTVNLCSYDHAIDRRENIAIFRIVQEALTNAARHSQATDVRIETTQVGTKLVLTVGDNGIGFPPDSLTREGAFGLKGIRERAYLLGGHIELDNELGGGGRMTAHLPLQEIDRRQRRHDDRGNKNERS